VLLKTDDGASLTAIDATLAVVAEHIERTRKGLVWNVWVGGRPVHVSVVGPPPTVALAAGCNGPEDYDVLRNLSKELAGALDGVATEPIK